MAGKLLPLSRTGSRSYYAAWLFDLGFFLVPAAVFVLVLALA